MPNVRLAEQRAAAKYRIDPRIFQAMIGQESGHNPDARSGAGAQGIAQFMPATAAAYGVNLHDGRITDDLEGAAHHIADNLKKTGGNYHKALSIYNSGRADAFRDPNFAGGQTFNYVKNILAAAKSQPGGSPAGHSHTQGSDGTLRTEATTSSFDRTGYEKARRLAILGNYLAQRSPNDPLVRAGVATPGALPDKADFTKTSTRIARTALTRGITNKGYSDTTAQLIARANKLNAKHFPYQWGGGHDKRRPVGSVPVDCSGAVSQVLGIDPRVASQFKSFGKPGRGRITIYAKDTHVLMEINGHFFGTSASNPGGGAGWIPRSAISPEYLKGFTARHIDA